MGLLEQFDRIGYDAVGDDARLAERLRAAIVQACEVRIGWSKKSWTQSIQRLNKNVDDPERVSRVLEWYCENIGKEFVPQAFCAETFRKKFVQIEQAMLRQQPLLDPVTVEEALLIDSLKNQLSRLAWGNGRLDTLELSIQITLNEREQFLLDLYDKMPEQPSGVQMRFLKELRGWLADEKTFVLRWYEGKSADHRNWKNWSGDFKSLAFRPTCKEVESIIRRVSGDYCHSQQPANDFLRMLRS
jgi:hypothetical protein